jgi:hypothetical protein
MPVAVKKTPLKLCQFCGKILERKRFNGRLEALGAFLRRKFCSLICSESKKDGLTKHGYSWRAREFLKSECEACGTGRDLHAHHIVQDITGNVQENIQTLCKHCHGFWHSTAKRLRRPIAGKMPPLYDRGEMD